ncbi:MAG: hypothetical protein ABIF18_03370 [archaeon]
MAKNLKEILTGTGIVGSVVVGLAATIINLYSACIVVESFNRGYTKNEIENSETIIGLDEGMEVGGSFTNIISTPGRYIVYGLDYMGLVEHGPRTREDTPIRVGGCSVFG